jgi:hypothetical protein
MSDGWLALTWIVVIAVFGAVVAAVVLARARTAAARAGAADDERYRQLAERCTASQQQAAAELGRLTERLTAVEKLLRDIG